MTFYHKCFLFFFIISSSVASGQEYSRGSFPNVLNIRQQVNDPKNIEQTLFSDLGAWHGYALPEKAENFGSFIGPMVMDLDGQWLANAFCQLRITEEGKLLNLSLSESTQTYFPGMLQQSFHLDELQIEQQLIFVSNRSARIRTIITNQSSFKRKLSISFSGEVLLRATLEQEENGIRVKQENKENTFTLQFEEPQTIRMINMGYATHPQERILGPGESLTFTNRQSYFLEKEEMQVDRRTVSFEDDLEQNEQRWNGYLNRYFSTSTIVSPAEQKLAVKSIVTLLTNWRSAGKDLKHEGVFPSINYQGFYGVWSWDSWKQASGLALVHPSLAKDNIRCMFDYMDEHGMIADCIYTEKKENNWRDTKPPLAAWAVWNVYEQTLDVDFVRELYPQLKQYHQWWYRNRDHDRNRLCEYGSTDGTRIAAAWESGMDNAVRYDSASMLRNSDAAWSLNQESVDLNAYLYAEKLYMAKLSDVIKAGEGQRWKAEAAALLSLIRQSFYSNAMGYYYDRRLGTGGLIFIEGPEAWICLWAGVATPAQAKAVVRVVKNEKKFNTKVPMPTLTASHPMFDPHNGYWRGPVWLDQFHFGMKGLQNYGYNELADELTTKLLTNAEGLLTDQPVCENYHPLTGECLNAKNFSWSAAHILMLLNLEDVN